MTRKRKHPDTLLLDWLEKHREYDLCSTVNGRRAMFFNGKMLFNASTFRRAITAAMRHQRKNGGGK